MNVRSWAARHDRCIRHEEVVEPADSQALVDHRHGVPGWPHLGGAARVEPAGRHHLAPLPERLVVGHGRGRGYPDAVGDVGELLVGADFQRKLVDGLAGIVVAPNRVSVLKDPAIAIKLPPATILAEQSKGILAWPGTPYEINAIFQLAITAGKFHGVMSTHTPTGSRRN